jgi:hypothetical protein
MPALRLINRARTAELMILATLACAGTTIPGILRVAITAPEKVLTRGASTALTASAWDSNGELVVPAQIAWASRNPAVAVVSSAGLVQAVATGTATIVAGVATVRDSVKLDVTEIPAPEPGAADAILWRDDFNKASFSELVAPYARRGAMQLIADGHTGQAIRFPYTASSWESVIEKQFPVTTDVYFRYWYRLSPGADPTCGGRGPSGFKWFMPWRLTTTLRYTMGVGNLSGGPSGFENTGLEFASHDNTSQAEPNPFMQNINKSKTFKTTADGAWHKYTLHVVTTPNGYEQIWIDGVLVLDNSAYKYDHDPNGIGLIDFPGTMVTWFAGCDFTVDADDLVIWHK